MAAPAGKGWQQVEELFYAALERLPADRERFLDEACGADAVLRNEVQSLLDASGKTLSFLEKPVYDAARDLDESKDAAIGRQIGAYRLLRVIGDGGMGRVYLAARVDDLYRQQVAIKLMHASFAQTQRMLLRFGAERQILANLNHPNIARLLDGGVDAGLPYLVMEYVDGIPIDDYCREKKLSTEGRLRLFTTVCGAVEYAHKNLVVHRDIKPGNILVTAEGVPKLLDFGIAKLLKPDGTEAALTVTTDRMMTPEYSSPEVLLGETITTSSDVYALGVLLYELLSGKRPFQMTTSSPIEVVKAICQETPTAPSQACKARPELAPPDAARKVKGELDNIVLMAMRKEPARRYVSVSQLSDDVNAFLGGYPVRARTDTFRYRSTKFIERHKAGVVAAVIVALALVGSSIGMGILARKAERDRQSAEREAQFLNSIFQASTPDQARGRQVTARELLDEGAKRVDTEFSGEPLLQARMLDSIGRAYSSLGQYKTAESLLQRAYDLRRKNLGESNLDTAATGEALGTSIRLQGDYKRADPFFRDGLAVREAKLGPKDELVGEALANLGECVYLEDKDAEAEPMLRRAREIGQIHHQDELVNASDDYLALLLERKGAFGEATQLLRESVDIARRAEGADSPDYAISLHNLAGNLYDAGDLAAAEKADLEVLALRRKINGPGHPDLGYPLNNLGVIHLERGDTAGAEPFLKENLEVRKALSNKSLAAVAPLNNWARLLQQKGNYKEADSYYRQVADILRDSKGPESWPLAKVLANQGLLYADEGKLSEAEQQERQVLEMRKKLGGDESPDLASSMVNLALVLSFEGNAAGGEPLLRRALEIRKKELSAGHPTIVATEVRLGEALIDEGKSGEAEPLLRQAVEEIHAVPFALTEWQFAEAEIALGAALAANGQKAEAEKLLRDPGERLKGYPQATLHKQILARAEKAQAALR